MASFRLKIIIVLAFLILLGGLLLVILFFGKKSTKNPVTTLPPTKNTQHPLPPSNPEILSAPEVNEKSKYRVVFNLPIGQLFPDTIGSVGVERSIPVKKALAIQNKLGIKTEPRALEDGTYLWNIDKEKKTLHINPFSGYEIGRAHV